MTDSEKCYLSKRMVCATHSTEKLGHCNFSRALTLTQSAQTILVAHRFPANTLGGWLATSKLQQRSAGHRLVLLQCLDPAIEALQQDGRMCMANQLPKAVVPALAFVIGTMLVVQGGLVTNCVVLLLL